MCFFMRVESHPFHSKECLKNPLKLCGFKRQGGQREQVIIVTIGIWEPITAFPPWHKELTEAASHWEKQAPVRLLHLQKDAHSILDTTVICFFPFSLQENNDTIKNTLKSLKAFESLQLNSEG